jgi:hypothetical protein
MCLDAEHASSDQNPLASKTGSDWESCWRLGHVLDWRPGPRKREDDLEGRRARLESRFVPPTSGSAAPVQVRAVVLPENCFRYQGYRSGPNRGWHKACRSLGQQAAQDSPAKKLTLREYSQPWPRE